MNYIIGREVPALGIRHGSTKNNPFCYWAKTENGRMPAMRPQAAATSMYRGIEIRPDVRRGRCWINATNAVRNPTVIFRYMTVNMAVDSYLQEFFDTFYNVN